MHEKHVKFIFSAKNSHLLGNVDNVHRVLTRATQTAGMRPLDSPLIYDVPLQIQKLGSEPYEDEGGVTGVLVLSTSHCAIHTWPLQNRAVMDLYSCRDFETEKILKTIIDVFDPDEVHVRDISEKIHRSLEVKPLYPEQTSIEKYFGTSKHER